MASDNLTLPIAQPQYAVSSVINEELEAAMLCRLMSDKEAPMQVLPLLREDCFTLPAHRCIFKAIVTIDTAGYEVTNLSVTEELYNSLTPDRARLIVSQAASAFGKQDDLQPVYMAMRLKEYAIRRGLAEVSKKIMRLNSDMTYPMEQGVQEVQELLDKALMGNGQDAVESLSEVLGEVRQITQDNQNPATLHTGILCGLPEIDREGGLPNNGLVIIGAKTSHGKTTFAINLAVHALLVGHKIACFSIEMTRQRVAGRIVSMRSGVCSNAIMRKPLSPTELQRTHQAIDELQGSVAGNFFFDTRNTRDITGLCLMISSLHKTRGVDMVVIDYAQLVEGSPGERYENDNKVLADLSHKLQYLARDLQICILLLSQVNRNTVGTPVASNLRGSGEIEEAADMIILLYNAYHAKTQFEAPYQGVDTKDKLFVDVYKYRDSSPFTFLCGFIPALTLITPLSSKQLMQEGGRQMTLF